MTLKYVVVIIIIVIIIIIIIMTEMSEAGFVFDQKIPFRI